MAIRSFGKADRGVQVSRWDPLPQGSPGERSADNRQGDGSIPSAATKFYSGQVELAHHDGLISRSSITTLSLEDNAELRGTPAICAESCPGEQHILDLTSRPWQGPPRSFFWCAGFPESGMRAPS